VQRKSGTDGISAVQRWQVRKASSSGTSEENSDEQWGATMAEMTAMQNEIWNALPLVKYLLGRKKINALIDSAIAAAPFAVLEILRKNPSYEESTRSKWVAMTRELHAKDATFGPLFWLLVLPLLQVLIRKLIEWWLSDRENRISMTAWHAEAHR
jgi:hypothetical protein